MVRFNHEKIYVTIVLQNLFHLNKCIKTLDLNCTYCILYRVAHDLSSLTTLSKEIYPAEQKCVLSAYNQATNKPYGYILLDINQNKLKDLGVVNDIIDNEITLCQRVNSKKKGHKLLL